jgi:peroxiredoxin
LTTRARGRAKANTRPPSDDVPEPEAQETAPAKSEQPRVAMSRYQQAKARQRRRTMVFGVIGLAVGVLAMIFYLNNQGGAGEGKAGAYPYQVGTPGPGEQAPAIALPSTGGGTFSLEALKGQTVLLYFQEGVMCQPCWNQIKDIEAEWPRFQALGIDKLVSITVDPLDALRQKVRDEGLATPLLSDPDLRASKAYEANKYGMMGTSFDGHSFVLVDGQGVIRWRADYGGPPKHFMYIPVSNLLADMGLAQKKPAA